MNRKCKNAIRSAVVGGTLKDITNAFKEHTLVFDETYFDYELLIKGLRRNNLRILQFLINKIGCRAGFPNRTKLEETPLHLAMKLDNEYIVKKVLSKGALVFDENDEGEIALYVGFKNHNFTAVRALLTHCKPKCNPNDRNTLLHFQIACATNHIAAVKHYLKCGVNPNIPYSLYFSEYSGLTPLQYAAENNVRDLCKILVHHGADFSVKNDKGLSPIHIMYYTSPAKHRKSIIKEIFEYGNNTKYVNLEDNNRMSHFHLCCMLNDPNFVQVFINNGVNVNCSISSRCTINPCFTPLHFAIVNGCDKVVELLVKNGADCNKKDNEGNTLLHYACKISEYWKAPIIKMLLDYKADPTMVDKHRNTPIHVEFCTAKNENQYILNMLFPKTLQKDNFVNNEGLSYFHIACAINNISQVKYFLDFGVKVDSCVSSGIYGGYTALHFAVLHNSRDVVILLLKKNAQVNFQTKLLQTTALHLACELNYAKFFKENSINHKLEDFKFLPVNLDAIYNRTNQFDIINFLLDHGAHINAKDYRGITPLLHTCMIYKNYCKLNWFFDSSKDGCKREGLLKEITIRVEKIIEILLCNKAMLVSSDQQESILHLLCKYSRLRHTENLIKLILSKGANINTVDIAGLTPLHVAVKENNKRMVKILLKHNADVNIMCKNYKTPLNTAFSKLVNGRKDRNTEVFCSLLENGSDTNIKVGEENQVLLHAAINSGDPFIVSKLLYYGADINVEDSLGNSCVSPLLEWFDTLWFHSLTFKIIYIHVQKLLALGLHVSKKVQKYCNQLYQHHKALLVNEDTFMNLDNIFHDCIKELERMKLQKIDNYTSLYSILLKDQNEVSKHVKNQNLIKRSKPTYLKENFPLYGYLLKLQFRKGLIRSYFLHEAKISLTTVTNVQLPDLCSEVILKHLTNEEIFTLKIAALLIKFLKRRALKKKLDDTTSNQKQCSPKLKKKKMNI